MTNWRKLLKPGPIELGTRRDPDDGYVVLFEDFEQFRSVADRGGQDRAT